MLEQGPCILLHAADVAKLALCRPLIYEIALGCTHPLY